VDLSHDINNDQNSNYENDDLMDPDENEDVLGSILTDYNKNVKTKLKVKNDPNEMHVKNNSTTQKKQFIFYKTPTNKDNKKFDFQNISNSNNSSVSSNKQNSVEN